MIEVEAAEETLEIFFCLRLRHSINGLNLCWKQEDAGGRDEVSKERDLSLAENALFPVDGKTCGVETRQDLEC